MRSRPARRATRRSPQAFAEPPQLRGALRISCFPASSPLARRLDGDQEHVTARPARDNLHGLIGAGYGQLDRKAGS